ncbi:MAG: O-antigen ligase family protein, partial [Burkholderiales bacterium]
FIGFLYLIIHLVQISSLDQIRRLDAPIRVFLLSGLIALPVISGRPLQDYKSAFAISGITFGVITIFQFMENNQAGRYFGFYGYHNLMALAALTNTITLLWLLKEKVYGIEKYLILIGILGGITACLLSGTRASWILIIITMTFYLANHKEYDISKRLTTVLFCILFFVGTVLLLDSFDARFQSTITDINNISNGDRSGSIGLRLTMAEMAFSRIAEHPWIGNGLSDFHQEITRWADSRNMPADAMERGFQNSHHQFLHWAQSLGIPCAVLATYMLLVWPLKIGKSVQDISSKLLKIFVFVCLLFFVTEAVLDRHHGSMWYAAHLGLLLGFVLHARQKSSPQESVVDALT